MTQGRLVRIVRYPVKGFSGHDVDSAEVRPGGGIPYDRVLAVADGRHGVPDGGRWAPTRTFVRLTTRSDLLAVGVELDAGRGTVTLTHPRYGGLTAVLGEASSLRRAGAVLASWFPGPDGAAPALVQAERGYWDIAEGTLSLINLDSVAALARELRVPVDPLRFRGNLYVSGLGPWQELDLVGEHVRVGGAEIQVLSPVNRCRATAVDPDTSRPDLNVPAELAARFGHLYCGLRARVVSPGTLRTGDRLARTGRRGRPAADRALPPPANWPRHARIVRVVRESATVTSFWLRDPFGGLRAAPRPGQHLRVHAADRDGPLWRCYTVSAVDGDTLRISVRRRPGGRMSRLLDREARPAGRLLVSGPHGSVALDAASSRPLLLAGAGVGITQTLALLRACAADNPGRRVVVCHTARDGRSLALWQEVRGLLAGMPDAHARLFLTAPAAGEAAALGAAEGRPDVADVAGRLLPLPDAEAYLCGPPGFTAAARDGLTRRGVPGDRVRQEVFASPRGGAGRPAPPPEPGPFRVSFTASGVTARWDAGSGTLLDVAENAGVAAPAGCRSGACHTCVQPLGSGRAVHTTAPSPAPPPGTVLLCCAVPTGDVALPL